MGKFIRALSLANSDASGWVLCLLPEKGADKTLCGRTSYLPVQSGWDLYEPICPLCRVMALRRLTDETD